jgi:hypothetical protein
MSISDSVNDTPTTVPPGSGRTDITIAAPRYASKRSKRTTRASTAPCSVAVRPRGHAKATPLCETSSIGQVKVAPSRVTSTEARTAPRSTGR